MLKITFELSKDAAFAAALNAGCTTDDQAELVTMGIQRDSRFKVNVKDSNQRDVIIGYQRNGYYILKIEVA